MNEHYSGLGYFSVAKFSHKNGKKSDIFRASTNSPPLNYIFCYNERKSIWKGVGYYCKKGLFKRANLKTPSETALFRKSVHEPADAKFPIKQNKVRIIYSKKTKGQLWAAQGNGQNWQNL